jgi:hypothetical protein
MRGRRAAAIIPNLPENTGIYRRCIRRRYRYISCFGQCGGSEIGTLGRRVNFMFGDEARLLRRAVAISGLAYSRPKE